MIRISSRRLFLGSVGLGILWLGFERYELSQLRGDIQRYESKLGRLQISDPSKMHFRRMPGSPDQPAVFEWLVHLPSGVTWSMKRRDVLGKNRGGIMCTLPDASLSSMTVGLVTDAGSNSTFMMLPSITSWGSLPPAIENLIVQYRDRLEYRILGEDETETVSMDQLAVVLAVHVPSDLLDQLPDEEVEVLGPDLIERLRGESLLDFVLGSEQAYAQADAAEAEAEANKR